MRLTVNGDFGNNLKKLREGQGISYQMLSNQLEISMAQLRGLESGHLREIDSGLLKRLSEALNTNVTALIWDGEPHPEYQGREGYCRYLRDFA